MLYGPAISQSDCRKVGPYQLPCNNASAHRFRIVFISFTAIYTKTMKRLETVRTSGNLLFSLTKLMVSNDLPRSTVTNQIAFDQQDLDSTP